MSGVILPIRFRPTRRSDSPPAPPRIHLKCCSDPEIHLMGRPCHFIATSSRARCRFVARGGSGPAVLRERRICAPDAGRLFGRFGAILGQPACSVVPVACTSGLFNVFSEPRSHPLWCVFSERWSDLKGGRGLVFHAVASPTRPPGRDFFRKGLPLMPGDDEKSSPSSAMLSRSPAQSLKQVVIYGDILEIKQTRSPATFGLEREK